MHVWEKEYVERLYPDVLADVRVDTRWGYGVNLERFHRTHLDYQANPSTDLVDPMMLGVHTHGMLALLAAELGDTETRDGLLQHADAVMRPTWKQGGLYYPRCDDLDTEHYVTCTMGNALLGAARITPADGFHALYNAPWGATELDGPQVVDVDHPRVLITAARYDHDQQRLTICLQPGDGAGPVADFAVTGLDSGKPVEALIDGRPLGGVAVDGTTHGAGVSWSDGRLRLQVPLQAGCTLTLTQGS